jgi:hypothetical protein
MTRIAPIVTLVGVLAVMLGEVLTDSGRAANVRAPGDEVVQTWAAGSPTSCKGTLKNVNGSIQVGDCFVQNNPAAFRAVAAECMHGYPCMIRAVVVPRDAQSYTVRAVHYVRPSIADPMPAQDVTCSGLYRGVQVGYCDLKGVNEHGEAAESGQQRDWAPGVEKVERACRPNRPCTIRARVVPVAGTQYFAVLQVYSATGAKPKPRPAPSVIWWRWWRSYSAAI